MTEFTTEKINDLREIVERATPGARKAAGSLVEIDGSAVGQTWGPNWRGDRNFMVVITPDVVIGLLDALEAKTAEVDAKADYVSDLEERVRQRDNHVVPVLHARIKEAEAAREELQGVLERVKAARAFAPECDKYDDDSPITCGWKRTVQSIDAALETGAGDE